MAGDGPPSPAGRPHTSGRANSSSPVAVVARPRTRDGMGMAGLLWIEVVIIWPAWSSGPGADGGHRGGQVGQRDDPGRQSLRPAGAADVDGGNLADEFPRHPV